MTDNEAKREKTFEEELPYVEERIKEVFNNYHNPNGCEDRLEICVLRDCKRTIRKAKEEINRQKVEVERLKSKNEILSHNADNAFQEGLNECRELFEPEIKSEAYKEFAEKLENEINCRTTLSREQDKNVIHIMHNLLKEMVGEEE